MVHHKHTLNIRESKRPWNPLGRRLLVPSRSAHRTSLCTGEGNLCLSHAQTCTSSFLKTTSTESPKRYPYMFGVVYEYKPDQLCLKTPCFAGPVSMVARMNSTSTSGRLATTRKPMIDLRSWKKRPNHRTDPRTFTAKALTFWISWSSHPVFSKAACLSGDPTSDACSSFSWQVGCE